MNVKDNKKIFLNVIKFILLLFGFLCGRAFSLEAVGKITEISSLGSKYESTDISLSVSRIAPGDRIAVFRNGKKIVIGEITLITGKRATAIFKNKGLVRVGDPVYKDNSKDPQEGSLYPTYHPPKISSITPPSDSVNYDLFIKDPPQVLILESPVMNAYCTKLEGKYYIILTERMAIALYAYCYYIAIGEIHNPELGKKGIKYLIVAEAIQSNRLPPYPELTGEGGAVRKKIRERAEELYQAMIYFVLSHEAGHIFLGHLDEAENKITSPTPSSQNKFIDMMKISNIYKEREMEINADKTATIVTLNQYAKTGAEAISYFVFLMESVEQLQGTPPEYLSTHPHWSTRWKNISKIIEQKKNW